ncbi:response regulator receiver protein [Candidatus Magnetomorum sp. HK-1]|nr:response regulator receiver protein [Candidatus Magnetomorum sp. HK-1]
MEKQQEHTILVVDDDNVNLVLMDDILNPNFNVIVAMNGEEALKSTLVEVGQPDLILLDVSMPVMDGFEVCRRLKEDKSTQHIPIVFLTCMDSSSDVAKGLELGAYYYLTKPVDIDSLMIIIRSALEHQATQRELRSQIKKNAKTLGLMKHGLFHLRTIEEAKDLAVLLSNACPDPKRVVSGMTELLLNAIEHGNLGITYEEKSQLLVKDLWMSEIEHRLTLPENDGKRVVVEIERTANEICFLIKDQGQGFEWEKYLDFDPKRAFDFHGRGIALAKKLSFDYLEYRGVGNEVFLRVIQTTE